MAAKTGVAAGFRDRRQWLDLRRPPRRLRGGRPALRPRPLVPVPDGAARPPRRVRRERRRVREAVTRPRRRVPAEGTDVRALLADRAARPDAAEGAAVVPRRA